MLSSVGDNNTNASLHVTLQPWSIFLFSDYLFQNTWETRDKYGIILSDKDTYYSIIICFTTSKIDKYKEKLSPADYVFIPSGTWWIFTKDTLILVKTWNIHKIERDKFPVLSPKFLGNLNKTFFSELLEKFKSSNEISNFYKQLL